MLASMDICIKPDNTSEQHLTSIGMINDGHVRTPDLDVSHHALGIGPGEGGKLIRRQMVRPAVKELYNLRVISLTSLGSAHHKMPHDVDS